MQENGDFLLQESGDKIVLSYGAGAWTNESKIVAGSWTNESKNLT